MPNEQKNQQDPNIVRTDDEKGIEAGYQQDTGDQKGDAATAGGREGRFSFEDDSEVDAVEKNWSPTTDPPKA